MAAVVPDKKFIQPFVSAEAPDVMLRRGWIDGLETILTQATGKAGAAGKRAAR